MGGGPSEPPPPPPPDKPQLPAPPPRPPPPDKPQLPDKEVRRGEEVTFVWKGCGIRDYRWLKNDHVLCNGGRISISRDGDYFHLTIKEAKEKDEGKYTLELTGSSGGTASGSATVNVLEYDKDWRSLDFGKSDKMKTLLADYKLSNPMMKQLRFLLIGLAGAGKSSAINSINSTFQGRVNVKALTEAFSDISFTKSYETYVIKNKDGAELPFAFNDVMGFEYEERSGAHIDDIISALKGHVKDKYKFNQVSPLCEGDASYNSSPTLDDKVHCLVNVISADKLTLLDAEDAAIQKMKKVRKAASNLGMPQVVFLTHVDMCCPLVKEDLKNIYSSKKIKQTMQKCSNMLGVPMNCIFAVKNYSEENNVNEEVDCLILDALRNAVNFANEFMTDK